MDTPERTWAWRGGSQQTAPEPTACVAGRLRALLMQQRESASSARAVCGLTPARASAGNAAWRRSTARALAAGSSLAFHAVECSRSSSQAGLWGDGSPRGSSPSRSSKPVPAGTRRRLPLFSAGSSDLHAKPLCSGVLFTADSTGAGTTTGAPASTPRRTQAPAPAATAGNSSVGKPGFGLMPGELGSSSSSSSHCCRLAWAHAKARHFSRRRQV